MERLGDVLKELSAEKAGLEERVREAVYGLVREFEERTGMVYCLVWEFYVLTGICVEEAVFRRKYLPNERGIKDFKEDCLVNVELDLKV